MNRRTKARKKYWRRSADSVARQRRKHWRSRCLRGFCSPREMVILDDNGPLLQGDKIVNQFEKLAAQLPFTCDICGDVMLAMWGGGWDNDRIVCASGQYCGAEIVFATSTPVEWQEDVQEIVTPVPTLEEARAGLAAYMKLRHREDGFAAHPNPTVAWFDKHVKFDADLSSILNREIIL